MVDVVQVRGIALPLLSSHSHPVNTRTRFGSRGRRRLLAPRYPAVIPSNAKLAGIVYAEANSPSETASRGTATVLAVLFDMDGVLCNSEDISRRWEGHNKWISCSYIPCSAHTSKQLS
jgi:hypothetical protein